MVHILRLPDSCLADWPAAARKASEKPRKPGKPRKPRKPRFVCAKPFVFQADLCVLNEKLKNS